ncbi:hypothetical protein DVH26_00435 [Paenibacillus sp. H1-7]|uniref:hypothetical protein n=1 Tax=Paenibacillus sp. H1-7 TaxID=2282849 RepID=UPI001EF82C1E|nr:hypothetical protein [Paenibacillus sp. H1-7]ULL13076.1 hypothetical protein DVH26_00435 [Paenibacillus sp. H1-7]
MSDRVKRLFLSPIGKIFNALYRFTELKLSNVVNEKPETTGVPVAAGFFPFSWHDPALGRPL